jgi:hypothetical protein
MPKTPPTAHSMWGHSADGVEWMYKTPRVVLMVDPPDLTLAVLTSGLRAAFPDILSSLSVPSRRSGVHDHLLRLPLCTMYHTGTTCDGRHAPGPEALTVSA